MVKILGRPTTVFDLVGWSRSHAVVLGEPAQAGTGTATAAIHRTRCSGLRRGCASFGDDTYRFVPQFRSHRNSASGQAASRQ